ncbi:MAG: hypothetical protein ACXAAK_03160 [Candidatus Thorarchaeota archaeon]
MKGTDSSRTCLLFLEGWKGSNRFSPLCKNIELGDLATKLKSKLACGGAAKHGQVELQGDHRGVIGNVLEKLGFPTETVQVDWTFQRRGRR